MNHEAHDCVTSTRERVLVAVALGSNLGDRTLALRFAVKRLAAHSEIELERVSNSIENAAVGGEPGQNDYLNAVLTLTTGLSPRDLLAYMLLTEAEFGRDREREGPNGARTLDLDLLLYGDLVLSEAKISVPHPRMLERDFVLQPLCEIAPNLRHPLSGRSIEAEWQSLQSRSLPTVSVESKSGVGASSS